MPAQRRLTAAVIGHDVKGPLFAGEVESSCHIPEFFALSDVSGEEHCRCNMLQRDSQYRSKRALAMALKKHWIS